MNTKKTSIREENIKNDKGILISELISLVDRNDPIVFRLFEKIKIDDIINEFIPIKGAKTLFNSQLILKENLKKIDLISKLNDISFYNDDNDDFCFQFSNIDEPKLLPNVKNLYAYPIYSAQRDFFSKLFGMDKYAKNLINSGFKNILNKNLELIKVLKKNENRYRLLYNFNDSKYYLRAIVSKKSYYDYNNSIAVVIGLIILYNEMKETGILYSLKSCEYNESYIRMFFDTSETRELEGIGFVRNIIEISNDEIKRESLKFLSVCSINYEDKQNKKGELFLKPMDVKSKVFSIKHNQKPETAVLEFSNINTSKEKHEELYAEILKIKNIKKPEQIKFLIKEKIDKAKNDDIKKFSASMINELTLNTTNNILDLLKLFNKLQIIAKEDIEASEYLRFVFYDVLIKNKQSR